MELYRTDWDAQNPKDLVIEGPPMQRLAWKALATYAKSKNILACPEEVGSATSGLGYIYRSGPRTIDVKERTALSLEPSSVAAYCMEHLDKKVVQGPFECLEYEMSEDYRYSGLFQALRVDTSARSINAKRVETWVSDGKEWYELSKVPKGLSTFMRTERFPGEPWPPQFSL